MDGAPDPLLHRGLTGSACAASAGTSETGPLARILTHIGWILGGKGYGAILSLFYLAVVTRALGPTGYGSFALILGSTLLLQAVLNVNVWQVLVKYGQVHLQDGGHAALARLVRFCTAVDLATAVAGILVAGLVLRFGGERLGMPDDLVRTAFAYVVAFMLSIRNVPRGVLRLHSRFSWIFLAESVVPTLKTLGAILALVVDPSLPLLLGVWAGSELASTLVFWWLAAKSCRPIFAGASAQHWTRAWHENDELPALMIAGSFGSVSYTLTQQLPILLVGSFAGVAETGLYRLAHQLAQSITVMAGFIGLASYTEMTNVHARDGLAGLAPLYRRLTIGTLTLFLAIGAVILLVGKPLLLLMSGPEFLGAYPFLLVLSLAACLQVATVNCEPMLMAGGHTGWIIAIRLAGSAALIGAIGRMLPAMGAIGAAWAKVVAEALSMVLLFGATFLALRRAADRARPTAQLR